MKHQKVHQKGKRKRVYDTACTTTVTSSTSMRQTSSPTVYKNHQKFLTNKKDKMAAQTVITSKNIFYASTLREINENRQFKVTIPTCRIEHSAVELPKQHTHFRGLKDQTNIHLTNDPRHTKGALPSTVIRILNSSLRLSSNKLAGVKCCHRWCKNSLMEMTSLMNPFRYCSSLGI